MVAFETCSHPNTKTKRYVGSEETYKHCPSCLNTWDGEETAQKKALIQAACDGDSGESNES